MSPGNPLMSDNHPVTPDGRYLVVMGRLWRRSNPALPPEQARALVSELMDARRELARRDLTAELRARTRSRVDAAKRSLGERGEVWWEDGAPDFNRHMIRNTPYADWFASLPKAG
nr:hypothetical protein [uncultured Roseateles sp.]